MSDLTLFDCPIRKIKWWERIVLKFLPTQTNNIFDQDNNCAWTQRYKMWRGTMYILDDPAAIPMPIMRLVDCVFGDQGDE